MRRNSWEWTPVLVDFHSMSMSLSLRRLVWIWMEIRWSAKSQVPQCILTRSEGHGRPQFLIYAISWSFLAPRMPIKRNSWVDRYPRRSSCAAAKISWIPFTLHLTASTFQPLRWMWWVLSTLPCGHQYFSPGTLGPWTWGTSYPG